MDACEKKRRRRRSRKKGELRHSSCLSLLPVMAKECSCTCRQLSDLDFYPFVVRRLTAQSVTHNGNTDFCGGDRLQGTTIWGGLYPCGKVDLKTKLVQLFYCW